MCIPAARTHESPLASGRSAQSPSLHRMRAALHHHRSHHLSANLTLLALVLLAVLAALR